MRTRRGQNVIRECFYAWLILYREDRTKKNCLQRIIDRKEITELYSSFKLWKTAIYRDYYIKVLQKHLVIPAFKTLITKSFT